MSEVTIRGREVSTRRPGVTPARAVALAVIAALTLGLAYIAFDEDASVSVPSGARAGDLILEPCTYETEDGSYAADCGTLVVSEDRSDPDSRLIALPVTRIHARSDTPAEPIFRLEGGPGVSNMTFTVASRLAEGHDVVLVGYRGVDGSVRLDCPEVTSAVERSTDRLSDESFRAYADAFRACADRLTEEGVDVTRYGLVQQADDLEAARQALGYERIDLLSESAGTRTAMIYAWRYPDRVHRSVMIGVNPPGNYMWDPSVTDEQIARYAEYCSQGEDCRSRTDDLAASMRATAADLPDRWLALPIEESTARVLSFFALMESTTAASPASGLMAIDGWLSAAEGDESGIWFASLAGDFMLPELFVWGQYAAAGSIDVDAARAYFASPPPEGTENLGYAASSFVWGGGQLADAWPASVGADEYTQVPTSQVETLLVSGELDFSTPPQVTAEQLLPFLPNGHQVVLEGLGHTVDFWNDQPEAGTHLIATYFDTGEVDASRFEPVTPDFTPAPTHTMIAKIVAVSLAGLALITVLSLLGIGLRARRRGGFGPVSGAVLRSVVPIVLGLGGWSLAVLVVLTAMPSVPLDGVLLAVLGAGVPVGLGVYLAWARRDSSAETNAAGFAAAMAGAMVGAWLGFLVGTGLVGLFGAVVGATLGANLVVILLDVAGGRPEIPAPPVVVPDAVPDRVDA
jgi:pimeloyl-ACP methyl ester carboxylesterase